MSEWLDRYGYPTDEALKRIEEWPLDDMRGLFDFIEPLWAYGDMGYWHRWGRKYWLSTAGWSGNESIIAAMKKIGPPNYGMIWSVTCQEWKRGGHYKFELPKRFKCVTDCRGVDGDTSTASSGGRTYCMHCKGEVEEIKY